MRLPTVLLAATCLIATACQPAGGAATPPREEGGAGLAPLPGEQVAARPKPVKRAPAPAKATAAGSRVLGKKDFELRGKPACEVDFVYAGRPAENLFWEEPCSAVTAMMVDRAKLVSLGRWDRLDSYARQFVGKLPGGRVLYVEGSFSASVYPVGTTGETYEVAVAD